MSAIIATMQFLKSVDRITNTIKKYTTLPVIFLNVPIGVQFEKTKSSEHMYQVFLSCTVRKQK